MREGGSLGWGGMGVGPFELNSRFGRPKTKIYVVVDTHTISVIHILLLFSVQEELSPYQAQVTSEILALAVYSTRFVTLLT